MSLPTEKTQQELNEQELNETQLEEVVGGSTEILPPTCQACTSGNDPINSQQLYQSTLLG